MDIIKCNIFLMERGVMARHRVKSIYDAEKVMKELFVAVAESYRETGELKLTAKEFDMSALKIRKLLITAGAYHSDISDKVNELYMHGKTLAEIQTITKLSRSSVNGYLPYTKVVYKPEELSLNAERIRVYRRRQKAVTELTEELSYDNLWKAVVAFRDYPFHTASGLLFRYELKNGRNGTYNKELIVNRRKIIVWSTIKLAFNEAVKMQGAVVERYKTLGDNCEVSYIYPMFYRFGIIDVPEAVAKNMRLRHSR